MKTKLFRVTTVSSSLNTLLKGQLQFLNNHFQVTAISGAGKNLDEVSKREGVKTFAITMSRPISPVKDIVSLFKLYRLFKREKPTIVHSITPKAGLLSMLAAKMAGVPIRIHTFTGLIFPSRKGLIQKLLIAMDKLLCWSATDIYPEGEGVKKDLQRFHITQKPLKVLANGNINGVNTEFFSPHHLSETQRKELQKKLGITPTDFVFIFVGRLVGDKGINELVNAFQKLKQKTSSSVKLLLIGRKEPHLDPLLPQTLTQIETSPDIIETGEQTDVRPYLAIANCFVFPSYREGFPNVVLEAGAMELPCIVTNINGSNEIIINGKNGLIVPAKNAEVFEEAMEEILNNPLLYDQLKSNARTFITSRYEQQQVWEALLSEYTRLLSLMSF
ncbi:glycosyl transferase [Capnocytophaga sp. HP1101]